MVVGIVKSWQICFVVIVNDLSHLTAPKCSDLIVYKHSFLYRSELFFFRIFLGFAGTKTKSMNEKFSCKWKQLIQKCDINTGMLWIVWRDGILLTNVSVRRMKPKKTLYKQEPQSDSIVFPRKRDARHYYFWYWMHLMSKNGVHSETNAKIDGLTKRMSNNKKKV